MNKLKMHSPDLTQANIDKIAELFPHCVVEAHDAKGAAVGQQCAERCRLQGSASTHWRLGMRLTSAQISVIRDGAARLAGGAARVWLFGSRVRDDARGGDVDLLLELDEAVAEPAQLSAQLAALVSRAMYGRKVDVLIKAPNLKFLPIHSIALAEGIRL